MEAAGLRYALGNERVAGESLNQTVCLGFGVFLGSSALQAELGGRESRGDRAGTERQEPQKSACGLSFDAARLDERSMYRREETPGRTRRGAN